MISQIRKLWLAIAATIGLLGAAFGATINYVADNGGGEYCGLGYGISVNVSTPASGYTVKYAEAETGPWTDALAYTNVCSEKPIYFTVEATGYATVTNSATVTITPKALTADYVWLVFPPDDYVYDGTVKVPDVAYADGDPSIITEDDFDVSFAANVNAGTATATFTGKGNYAGTVEEEFEIQKADNEWTTDPSMAGWTYGQTPSEPASAAKDGAAAVTYGTAAAPGAMGSSRPTLPGSYVATFTVAESQNYKALSEDVSFKILPATINYVADDVSGEYNGGGFGIADTISVSAPASGATVKYAESETGPWSDAVLYTNVCSAKPIYFTIEATGYASVTNSRTVTITPKTLTADYVWLVFPPEDYVYDGTAKVPDVAYADGDPSIITANDFDVSFAANVNAGTATATFTGKGNYTGTATEDFEIKKAKLNGGEEPGGGTVPPGGVSKFDVETEYDGVAHTVDTNAVLAAFQAIDANISLAYALSEDATDWAAQPEAFVNAGMTSIWYKASLENYEDFIHEVKISITPRDISSVSVAAIDDIVFDDAPVEPVPEVTDGDPSIITGDDYTLSYSGNEGPGAATLTLAGKRNYTGTKDVGFTILAPAVSAAGLKAEIAWKHLKATGTYFAQIKVTCTNGLEAGIANLRYLFADRVGADGKTVACLWRTAIRAANPDTADYDGKAYRYVELDPSRISVENSEVVFGVSDISAASIPVAERTVEMYVQRRVSPQVGNEGAANVGDFLGFVAWDSAGESFAVPVVAADAASGRAMASMPKMRFSAPVSLSELNASLAVGAALDAGSSPYCKLTAFSVDGDAIAGRIEVGAKDSAGETAGSLGENATVTVLGAESPGGGFCEISKVKPDEDGTFRLRKPEDLQFFRVRIDIGEAVK